MRSMTVTAETPAGFVAGDPWSPALDGILAFAAVRERLGADFGTGIDMVAVEGLPLAVERFGGEWWYASGLPRYEPLEQHDRHINRRFDAADAERFLVGRRRIETAMGPFKNMRKPRLVQVAASVSWVAVGDPDEVRRLLADVPSIGPGWSRGFGRVTRWRVEEGADRPIVRPVPSAYAEERGLRGRRIRRALRPPYHLTGSAVWCVIPDEEPSARQPLVDEFFAAVDDLNEVRT